MRSTNIRWVRIIGKFGISWFEFEIRLKFNIKIRAMWCRDKPHKLEILEMKYGIAQLVQKRGVEFLGLTQTDKNKNGIQSRSMQ